LCTAHSTARHHAGHFLTLPVLPTTLLAGVADVLSVLIGCEMLQVVPGRVSTEVDAHLSYDATATYDKAIRLLELYAAKGVDPSRVYIKIASTWEGIQACRRLQAEGISTNMTLLFSFGQVGAAGSIARWFACCSTASRSYRCSI
jgi:transaldolase